ncbi:Uncharacterized protein ChrSV_2977 [Chromobacterium vaccinii]|nr:Uncharacterized protein ChrSW_2977 [Chromobacterium vaccinii]QND90434.1 Uncharacterized protein ChrSV_2977 [Chromobacterium vaccinii]
MLHAWRLPSLPRKRLVAMGQEIVLSFRLKDEFQCAMKSIQL